MPEHKCYVEVFSGAAHVFFRKEPSRVEVLNDINRELITCYRVVQNHSEELCRYMSGMLTSRDEFRRFKATPPETLTDIQRAARFLYMQKSCFGGKYNGTFGISKQDPPRLNPETLKESILYAQKRLGRVYIECLPYEELIPRYDSPDALFYVDPPYFGMENYYGKGIFSREDFIKLRDLLKGIKGQFIMSINDTPEIRALYKMFYIAEVQTVYSVNSAKNKPVGELLITNYTPKEDKVMK
jgi:DNA adenine methylase